MEEKNVEICTELNDSFHRFIRQWLAAVHMNFLQQKYLIFVFIFKTGGPSITSEEKMVPMDISYHMENEITVVILKVERELDNENIRHGWLQ